VNKKLQSIQLDWLTRVARGSPVFVYANELGFQIPFVKGLEECALLFEVWEPEFRLRYFLSSVIWGVPLRRILAHLPRETFLEIVRAADSPWVKGRPWPLAAINCLSLGQEKAAFEVMVKVFDTLSPSCEHHLNAASIWYYLFSNQEQAKNELIKAGALLQADVDPHPSRSELARCWVEMFDDRIMAMDIVNQEIKALRVLNESDPYCEQALAGTLCQVMDDRELAMKYVPDAAGLELSECVWNGIDAYILWQALFDEPEKARACANIGASQPSEKPETHALLCKEVLGDESAAISLLGGERADAESSRILSPSRAAEGWILCYHDSVAAAKQLDNVTSNSYPDEGFRAVCYWYWLLYDNVKSETLLANILGVPDIHPLEPLQFAQKCVKDYGDVRMAHSMVELMESRVTHFVEWAECARVWWQAFANQAESARCMQKASNAAQTEEDHHVLALLEDRLSWTWNILGVGEQKSSS